MAWHTAGAENVYGQLGIGDVGDDRAAPVAVTGGLPFAMLSAGQATTCAATLAGQTYCWGDNTYDEFGDGSTTSNSIPVVGARGILLDRLALACGLTPAGKLYCWGSNGFGRIGDGTVANVRPIPVAVSDSQTFTDIAASNYTTCGMVTGDSANCWGWNGYGQLGVGDTTMRLTPVAVSGGVEFTSLKVGDAHTCGLTSLGRAYCWGYNAYGQLGDGSTTDRLEPVPVAGGLIFTSLAAGVDFTCGLTPDGRVYCWGDNRVGELGDGTTVDRLVPTPIANPRSSN